MPCRGILAVQECRMTRKPQRFFIPAVLWLAISAMGGVAVARLELNRLRDEFETNARIAHRLLSQRAVQHDAVMAMLALIQPPPDASQPEQRLPSVYPQIIGVQRRDRDTVWTDERLAVAEALSRTMQRPVLAVADFARGRYQRVLAADSTSFSIQLDLHAVAVTATVVDRAGTVRAMQRADNAGPHTLAASQQKAFTSASAKNTTLAMMEGAQKNPAAANLVYIPGYLLLGGGVPVKAGNKVIGVVGVGGAPGGNLDEQCAMAAIDKIKDPLK